MHSLGGSSCRGSPSGRLRHIDTATLYNNEAAVVRPACRETLFSDDFGTWTLEGDQAAPLVAAALQAGYRHIGYRDALQQ